MGRLIIIAVAVVMGALSVWFLVPTVPLAKVAEVPVSSSLPTSKEMKGKPVVSGAAMSAEKRRVRAEQLIGEPFKYISKTEVYSKGWFTDQGVQAIERAMDECFLLGDKDLFFEHMVATSESDVEDMDKAEAKAYLKSVQPTSSQLRNCVNANRAYNELYEAKG
jgi:hypothetical protein